MIKIFLAQDFDSGIQKEVERVQSTLSTRLFETVLNWRDADAIFATPDGFHKDAVEEWKAGGKNIVLVILDESHWGAVNLSGIDYLLHLPSKAAEFMNLARFLKDSRMVSDVVQTANQLDKIADTVQASVEMLERFQREWSPNRFNHLKGYKVQARHLSGLRPGGDFFDIFESKNKDCLNILLADSSTYGISSAFLGLLLSASAKIADDSNSAVSKWVTAMTHEIESSLGENGFLSLFFGRISRKEFTLRYQIFGSVEGYIVSQDGICTRLKHDGTPIRRGNLPNASQAEHEIPLHPKDRIVLLSDGFIHGMGGQERLNEVFQKKINRDPFELVDQLTFEVKRKADRQQDFLAEDCTAIVLDVDSRPLRLAVG